jgi:hypothetical protein
MEDVALFYKRGEEVYLLRLSELHATGEFVLADLLQRPAVQTFLDFSVVFPGREVTL